MAQEKLDSTNKKVSIAEQMAAKQKEVGIAEFFSRNRHLLGFDNKRKSLLTTVKEAVDNSLDACEEARILPEVIVEIIDMGNDRFKVIIEDNGPGIVKAQVPKVFAKLLYGSKFFKLSQSRGQQGIGISASVMYGQLTTGKPAKVHSKIMDGPANYFELKIDTQKNKPDITKEKIVEWDKEHGTRIEIDLEGSYHKGTQSVDEYLKETAVVNPHVTLIYTNPKAEQYIFPRATDVLPKEAVEIKPHPYGVELGVLMQMMSITEAKTLHGFLTTEFSRVGAGTAKHICESAALLPKTKPSKMTREMSEKLLKGIQDTKIIAPPTDCISPITAELLEKGLRKEINAEFYCSTTRPPAVYRGNPFIVEVSMAYGGDQKSEGQINIMRFANRVPLLYQQGACAVTKAVIQNNWRQYGVQQSKGAIPVGPLTVVIHLGSVWVPFTSESKEAIAHYPEIVKELRLGLQECGRLLASYVRKKKKIQDEGKKRNYIEKYIPHVADAIAEILQLAEVDKDKINEKLHEILEHKRGKIEDIKAVNEDYDEDFAKIGKVEKGEEDGEEK